MGFWILKKKKKGKHFEIIIDFYFITMAHILQNNSKKPTQYEFWKKKAIFINNQLECFFFFLFSSKIKYIYNIPKPKSQTPKDLKWITTFIKSTTSNFKSYRHWIKKSKPLSLFIAYSYGLGSNSITMLELCKCHCKFEDLKVNDIIFGLSVFEMRWHGELWACVYKWVEVKMVNGNAKSFLCEREKKSWNIESN